MAKRVPMRTCIGCGRICEKKELIRIVRTPEGEILADPAGRAEGRGAYLCRNMECLAKARKRKAFGRAFRTAVDGGQYESLRAQLEALREVETPPEAGKPGALRAAETQSEILREAGTQPDTRWEAEHGSD